MYFTFSTYSCVDSAFYFTYRVLFIPPETPCIYCYQHNGMDSKPFNITCLISEEHY
jgi:hypothetical protein